MSNSLRNSGWSSKNHDLDRIGRVQSEDGSHYQLTYE